MTSDLLDDDAIGAMLKQAADTLSAPAQLKQRIRARILNSESGPPVQPTAHAVEPGQATGCRQAGARRSHGTKPWIARTAVAMAAAASLALAIVFWPGPSGQTEVYGITEAAQRLRQAKTLHVQGLIWHYPEGAEASEFTSAVIIPTEEWHDEPNLRSRAKSHENAQRSVETIRNGPFAMGIDHDARRVTFYRLSPIEQRIEVRRAMRQYLNLVRHADLDQFVKVGQERLGSASCDIWEGYHAWPPGSEQAVKIRCWVLPESGRLVRLRTWSRQSNGSAAWRPSFFIETIEQDIEIPAKVFEFRVPADYKSRNWCPLALGPEGQRPSVFPPGKEGPFVCGLGDAHVSFGNATLFGPVSFTLDDGSVIAGWASEDRASTRPQDELFTDLKPGAPLPTLPLVIEKLKTGPSLYASRNEVSYVGRHLACTRQNGRFFEWAIYVPVDAPVPPIDGAYYTTTYRFHLKNRQAPRRGNPLPANTIDRDEFNWFVRGAMAELSDSGAAPPTVTHERVTELARRIRAQVGSDRPGSRLE